jgi:acylphosphatase
VRSACRFLVRGRVQGVGYRYFALHAARELGVAGFARNLPDGSVEIVAEGGEAALAAFEARLREGPSFARVEGVERGPATPRGDADFHIR